MPRRNYHETIEYGLVISQDPAGGTSVYGTMVIIDISQGPPATPPPLPIVPSVLGLYEEAARSLLEEHGFGVSTLTTAYHETIEEGYVITQTPPAGTPFAGTYVSLQLSSGPAPLVQEPAPNMQGMALQSAHNAAYQHGFGITEEFAYSDDVPENYIISQYPLPETPVYPGTSIRLTISRGPQAGETPPEEQTQTIPNLVGATESYAVAYLASHNLQAFPIHRIYHDTVPAGLVIYQSPPEGAYTTYTLLESVELVISLGVEEIPPEDLSRIITIELLIEPTASTVSVSIYSITMDGRNLVETFDIHILDFPLEYGVTVEQPTMFIIYQNGIPVDAVEFIS